ncbi:PREDICTED: COMM domain-containing protein 3-like isoform X3 [Ceratosolen solmsi marchali]|uniref:COMM domain-containing protein 3 n=1 Tax=Ceratosolen solmsi marchali TaxID=326594 RepID=A0AAJ6VMA8_9HYME|nr:PREDICTED: COMM domain-containing protein 3-like isoform X3 [Ceratosolen solmsi marchali]
MRRYITLALTQLCRSKPDVIKTAYADVIKLLIEAARHDTSSEELSKLLRCTALTKAHIDKFCQFHANYKEQLQENLETIGNGLPHIIDVDWRIDYCIKSSINDSAGIPNYNISLSTMKHGNIQSVQFMCTIQELQELVLKLKDAARHIEKLTNP